jgi:hypothetical protein
VGTELGVDIDYDKIVEGKMRLELVVVDTAFASYTTG